MKQWITACKVISKTENMNYMNSLSSLVKEKPVQYSEILNEAKQLVTSSDLVLLNVDKTKVLGVKLNIGNNKSLDCWIERKLLIN